MALKEKISCPRCDAKGVIPRYYYNRKGLCFLCYGEKYIYVRVPEGQNLSKVVAGLKEKETARLDKQQPKVSMPEKMRKKAFNVSGERKAFSNKDKEGPLEDSQPEKLIGDDEKVLQAKDDNKENALSQPQDAAEPIEREIATRYPLDQVLRRLGISETDPQQAYVEAIQLSGMDVDVRALQRIQSRAQRTAALRGGSPTLWAARILAQTMQAKPLRMEGKKDFNRLMRLTKDEIQDRVKELKQLFQKANKTVANLKTVENPDKGLQDRLPLMEEHLDELRTEMAEGQNILGLRFMEDLEYRKVADQTEPNDLDVRLEIMAEFAGQEGIKRLFKEFQENAKKHTTYRGFKQQYLSTKGGKWKEKVLLNRLVKAGRLRDPEDKNAFFNEIKGENVLDSVSASVNRDLFERAAAGIERESEAIELGRMMMEDIKNTKPDSLIALEQDLVEGIKKAEELTDEYDRVSMHYFDLVDSETPEDVQTLEATKMVETGDRLLKQEELIRDMKKVLRKAKGAHRMNRLREYREFGNIELQFEGRPNETVMNWAQAGSDFIPKDWLETSQSKSKLTPMTTPEDRSFFLGAIDPEEEMQAGIFKADDAPTPIAAHELMHYIEWGNPGVRKLEKEFFFRRAGTSQGIPDDGGYFYKTNFPHFYMNKVYAGEESFELLTMGIQVIMGDVEMSDLYDKDEEYVQFILGLLLGGNA